MCGIAGIINKIGINDADKNLLYMMSEKLKHRGPDGNGIFFDKKVGLVHRRLSIIDATDKGNQPMSYRKRYTITYNGEIYNYVELKQDLIKLGYTFSSDSDTEILLAAYDYYGVDCVKKFNGMWAFLLYDKEKNELYISRDRYGVKPLHYYIGEGYILFASEIKALLCDQRINRIANDELVFDFLADSLLDHTNATFFKEIYKIPPATYAIIKLDDPTYSIDPISYYDVDFSNVDTNINFEQARVLFRETFEDAVDKRLRSDVPVGTCLSGGLDSSSIVMAVNKEYKKRGEEQHTFSFIPSDKRINEKEYVDAVLERKRIVSHYINDVDFDIKKDFNSLVDAQEEPFRTMSMFAGYLVYKAARENGIVVLLDGQGADEILCGYRKSRIYYIKYLIKKHQYLRGIKELLLSLSQIKTTSSIKADFEKIKKIFNREEKYKSAYIKADFTKNHTSKDIYSIGDFQNVDIKLISLPILLRYVDRNSMAVSVESRLPFLDYRLVDLCSSIPVSMKIKNGYSKYIMREALDLPKKVKNRKSKFGFSVPETFWIEKYEKFFKGFFEEGRFRGDKYIDRDHVIKDWNKLVSGIDKNLLFRMISVAAWMEAFDVQTDAI